MSGNVTRVVRVKPYIVTTHPKSNNEKDKNMCIVFTRTEASVQMPMYNSFIHSEHSAPTQMYVCAIVARGKDGKIRKTSGFALRNPHEENDDFIASKIAFGDAIKYMSRELRTEMWKIFMQNVVIFESTASVDKDNNINLEIKYKC